MEKEHASESSKDTKESALYTTLEDMDSHVLTHEENGEMKARAVLEYVSSPFPLYYVQSISVPQESNRGRGYGTKILQDIHDFLNSEGLPAFLINQTSTRPELYDRVTRERIHMQDFYERHGWKYAGNSRLWMVYDTNKNLTDAQIVDAVFYLRHN